MFGTPQREGKRSVDIGMKGSAEKFFRSVGSRDGLPTLGPLFTDLTPYGWIHRQGDNLIHNKHNHIQPMQSLTTVVDIASRILLLVQYEFCKGRNII